MMIVAAILFLIPTFIMGRIGIMVIVPSVRDRDTAMIWFGAVILFGALCFGGGAVAFYWASGYIAEDRVDRADGVACVAELVAIHEKRALVNEEPVYRFRLRVQVPGKDAYEADSIQRVSPLTLGRIGAGQKKYHCRAGRDDPTDVEILWDRPATGSTRVPEHDLLVD